MHVETNRKISTVVDFDFFQVHVLVETNRKISTVVDIDIRHSEFPVGTDRKLSADQDFMVMSEEQFFQFGYVVCA